MWRCDSKQPSWAWETDRHRKGSFSAFFVRSKRCDGTAGKSDRIRTISDGLLSALESQLMTAEEISDVVTSHGHIDHVGNLGLFPNAAFYAHSDRARAHDRRFDTIAWDLNVWLPSLGEGLVPTELALRRS